MMMRGAAAAACLALLAVATARADQVRYGEGFDDWSFTQTIEKTGVVCRAVHRPAGRLDILAFQSSGTGYVSVAAGAIRGTFPNATLHLANGDISVGAQVSGTRLLLGPINEFAMDEIAASGGYRYVVPGPTGGTGEVDLQDRADEALDHLFQCIEDNAIGESASAGP